MKIKRIIAAALIFASLTACAVFAVACKGRAKVATGALPLVQSAPLLEYDIEHETKFGGVYIGITIDDFSALGFSFGDSVNITFTNGFTLKDIPYYNGFYVDVGEPLLVGYPGYPYIRAGYNNGDDMYKVAGLSPTDSAEVTLNKRAKYLDMQEAMDLRYSDEQGDRSDAVFANFRSVNVGDLKENVLYRSASPCDNQHSRAAVTDRLIARAGVGFIINLSDDEEELQEHISKDDFASPYFLSLYNADCVIPLSMNMAYKSEGFSAKLVAGLKAAAKAQGPYLVHCVEGKDRTGFVCMVIEALAGADYEEIVADYMVTYDNYYSVNEADEPVKYRIIKEKNIDAMLRYLTGDGVDLSTADYAYYCEAYLERIGMQKADIDALKAAFIAA